MDATYLSETVARLAGGMLGVMFVLAILSRIFGLLAGFAIRPQGKRVVIGCVIGIACFAALFVRALIDHDRIATPSLLLEFILGALIVLAMSRRRARKISQHQVGQSATQSGTADPKSGLQRFASVRTIVLWFGVTALLALIVFYRPVTSTHQIAEQSTAPQGNDTIASARESVALVQTSDGMRVSQTNAALPGARYISASDISDANFGDYPASKYAGPIRMPDFNGRDREFATYRTRIRQGLAGGANFAGNIAMIEIGCGTMCRTVYAANVATGKVHTFPLSGESNYKLTINYQPDSRLVVGVWENLDANQCYEDRYVWDGALFHLIDHTVIGTGDIC